MADLMTTYRIIRICRHHDGLKSFYFERSFDAQPGQFINLWIPGLDEKPFSISNMDKDFMEISVKSLGPFTKKLMEFKEGDFLGIRGPFGKGFTDADNVLLVGGGIGSAPLRFMANTLKSKRRSFSFILGGKSRKDILFADEYKKENNVVLIVEDGTAENRGLVTDFIVPILRKGEIKKICGAGPEGMLLAIRKIALSEGVEYELSFERYMKCGIGICGQCCMDGSGLRLCVEGPVLRESQLAGISELGLPHRTASGKRPIV